MRDPKILVALDFDSASTALDFVRLVTPQDCRLKVGKELFTTAGPRLVETLVDRGFDVFLDLKFHDIPNTVAGACRAAARLGVWMLNVHALGGGAMLRAAREAVEGSPRSPKLIAVTLLTSLAEGAMQEVGISGKPADAVLRLARLAQANGLDGVVCSAREAPLLRMECGAQFCLVTPGIRPAQGANDDQERVMTPAAAIAAGSDYLVVGRPVTQAPDPVAALRDINREIASRQSA